MNVVVKSKDRLSLVFIKSQTKAGPGFFSQVFNATKTSCFTYKYLIVEIVLCLWMSLHASNLSFILFMCVLFIHLLSSLFHLIFHTSLERKKG